MPRYGAAAFTVSRSERKLCTKKRNIISGSMQATTNLKRMHADVLPEFEQHKHDFCTGKKKTPVTTHRQTKLFTGPSRISQKKVDELIVAYVVKGMHPLSTVEQK